MSQESLSLIESITQKPRQATECPRCDAWWTGLNTAHCAAEQSAFGQLFALGDGNAGLGADWDAHPLEGAVDRSGVTGQLLADFVSAQSLRVEHRRLRPPRDSGVFESVVIGGHWSKVRWSIVGAVVIDVVNVLSVSDPSVEHPVLVGFDVLVRRDPPTKPHVTMRGDVPLRCALGNFLPRRQLSDGGRKSPVSTGAAEFLLDSTRDCSTTNRARFSNDHRLILQVTAMCHRTFTGITAFDKHRDGSHSASTRHCVKPESVGLVDAGRAYPCWGFPGTDTHWTNENSQETL